MLGKRLGLRLDNLDVDSVEIVEAIKKTLR